MKKEKDQNVAVAPNKKMSLTPVTSVIIVLGIFIVSQIVAANIVFIAGYINGMRDSEILEWLENSTIAMFATYLFVTATGIAFIQIVINKISGFSWSNLGLKRPKRRDALYALAGYGWYLPIYIVAAVVVSNVLPSVDLSQKQNVGFNTLASGPELLIIGISLIILPALYEELLFRGVLFVGLRSKLSFLLSAVIISALFAAAHLQWSADAPLLWAAAIDTFILSMILVYLKEKTGSLWPCIGLHAIKNSVAFVVLFVFKVA